MQLRLYLGVLGVMLSASLGAQPLNTFPLNIANTFPSDLADNVENTNAFRAKAQRTQRDYNQFPAGNTNSSPENVFLSDETDKILISAIREISGKQIKISFLGTESDKTVAKREGFSLKKIPLWVKIAVPVVVVTGVIILLKGGSSSDSSDDGGIVDPPRPK